MFLHVLLTLKINLGFVVGGSGFVGGGLWDAVGLIGEPRTRFGKKMIGVERVIRI